MRGLFVICLFTISSEKTAQRGTQVSPTAATCKQLLVMCSDGFLAIIFVVATVPVVHEASVEQTSAMMANLFYTSDGTPFPKGFMWGTYTYAELSVFANALHTEKPQAMFISLQMCSQRWWTCRIPILSPSRLWGHPLLIGRVWAEHILIGVHEAMMCHVVSYSEHNLMTSIIPTQLSPAPILASCVCLSFAWLFCAMRCAWCLATQGIPALMLPNNHIFPEISMRTTVIPPTELGSPLMCPCCCLVVLSMSTVHFSCVKWY